MSSKERIKQWFSENPNKWISTREVRTTFGECGDRRIRELRAEGFKIISKRREIDGKKFFTFYWSHPVEVQETLF